MMHKPPKVWAEWRLNWLPILRSSEWLFVPHRGACAVCLSVDTCNQEHSLISSRRQHKPLFNSLSLLFPPICIGWYHLDLQGYILLPTGKVSAHGALADSLMTQDHIAGLCFAHCPVHSVGCLAVSGHKRRAAKVQPPPNTFQDQTWSWIHSVLKTLCLCDRILVVKSLFIILGWESQGMRVGTTMVCPRLLE